MSAAVTAPAPAPVVIVGTLDAMKPITPRDAVLDALGCLKYIGEFGFLAEALSGNETTMGAMVLHRELAKARALLMALLAS